MLSAAGLLAAPVEHQAAAAHRVTLAALDHAALRAVLAALDAKVAALMALEKSGDAPVSISYSAELCYVGQSHFLEVVFDPGAGDLAARLYADFITAHERIYGHGTDAPAMIGSLRSTHRVARDAVASAAPDVRPAGLPDPKAHRQVLFIAAAAAIACPIYDRAALAPGTRLAGPAIIEQPDTTTVMEAGWTATVHRNGGLLLEAQPAHHENAGS